MENEIREKILRNQNIFKLLDPSAQLSMQSTVQLAINYVNKSLSFLFIIIFTN